MAALSKKNLELLIRQQFDQLKDTYANFELRQSSDGTYEIIGELHFVASYRDLMEIEDAYQIQIILSNDYPNSIPKVLETDNRIPISFHRYTNGQLCLGPPSEITNKFNRNKTVLDFVVDCVIPYLYLFSYSELHNGKLPWDDLSHGGEGILEHYQEIFKLDEVFYCINLL